MLIKKKKKSNNNNKNSYEYTRVNKKWHNLTRKLT